MANWIKRLSSKQLRRAFADWKQAKREIGETPSLNFEEWLTMERSFIADEEMLEQTEQGAIPRK